MTTMSTADQQEALDEAMSALQPFYDPGDDGDGVRIALNAIAGLLGERFDIAVPENDGLNHVLRSLKADQSLRATVRKLYKVAAGGAYGEGLSKKDASKVNDLVQDVVGPLFELVQQPVPKKRTLKRLSSKREKT